MADNLPSPEQVGRLTSLPLSEIAHQLRLGRSASVIADNNLMDDAADLIEVQQAQLARFYVNTQSKEVGDDVVAEIDDLLERGTTGNPEDDCLEHHLLRRARAAIASLPPTVESK